MRCVMPSHRTGSCTSTCPPPPKKAGRRSTERPADGPRRRGRRRTAEARPRPRDGSTVASPEERPMRSPAEDLTGNSAAGTTEDENKAASIWKGNPGTAARSSTVTCRTVRFATGLRSLGVGKGDGHDLHAGCPRARRRDACEHVGAVFGAQRGPTEPKTHIARSYRHMKGGRERWPPPSSRATRGEN